MVEDEPKKVKVEDIITLKSLNVEIHKGEFVCIIGEVGSGKSSLINAILGDMIYVDDEIRQNMGNLPVTKDTIKELVQYG